MEKQTRQQNNVLKTYTDQPENIPLSTKKTFTSRVCMHITNLDSTDFLWVTKTKLH